MAFLLQLRNVERPLDVPDHGLVCDILWADPDEVYSASILHNIIIIFKLPYNLQLFIITVFKMYSFIYFIYVFIIIFFI